MKRLGIPRDRAELMGKPSIGAHYEREDYRSHKLDDGARCVICGRRATDAHHVVPRSTARGYTVDTPIGRFVALSPLFALCRRCHDDVHMSARYRIRWEWDAEQYAEEWASGHTLAHVCRPGDPFLFQEGRYVVADRDTGGEWELRG